MTDNRFRKSINETLTRCCELLLAKGIEYAGAQDDRLAAFKQAAALERTTPQRALFGMLAKHLISVQNMCDREITDYSPERWAEKIGDAINYLLLLQGLVTEEFEEAPYGKH